MICHTAWSLLHATATHFICSFLMQVCRVGLLLGKCCAKRMKDHGPFLSATGNFGFNFTHQLLHK